MKLSDLNRFLDPIRRQIFLLIGKALITAVNNEGKTGFHDSGDRANPQRLTMDWFGQLTDIERSQPYGFEAFPVVGTSKAVLVSPDGSRSNAFVIMVQDDEYRPIDGGEGDVIYYGKEDATEDNFHRVHFKADGSIEIRAGENNLIKLSKDAKLELTLDDDFLVTVKSGKKIGLGNGTDELLDLLDQLLDEIITLVSATNLNGTVDLGGTASSGTLFKITAGLTGIENAVNTIKTNLGKIKV